MRSWIVARWDDCVSDTVYVYAAMGLLEGRRQHLLIKSDGCGCLSFGILFAYR